MNIDDSKNIPNSEYEEGEEEQKKSQDHKNNKTKPIAKKAGRPSKKAIIKQINNLVNEEQFNKQGGKQPLAQKIIVAIIDFFDRTGNKKGFVFARDIRNKLRKSIPYVADEEKWERIVELTKILKLCASQGLSYQDKAKIEPLMIETSGIFSQEFTDEYYLLFVKTYLLVKEERENLWESREERFSLLAEDIFSNKGKEYLFFSYSFLQLCNIGLKKPENSLPYRQLIHSLRECLLQQQ